MIDRYFYIEAYSDEIMPCAPTLEAWAKWLATEDESWPHPIAVAGDTFPAFTTDVVDDLTLTYAADGWPAYLPPLGATEFFVRYDGPESGWDVETAASSISECLEDFGPIEIGSELTIACTRSGPRLILRFKSADEPLEIVGEVQ